MHRNLFKPPLRQKKVLCMLHEAKSKHQIVKFKRQYAICHICCFLYKHNAYKHMKAQISSIVFGYLKKRVLYRKLNVQNERRWLK